MLVWSGIFLDFSILYQSTQMLFMNKNPYLYAVNNMTTNYPPMFYLLMSGFLLFSLSSASKIFLLISLLFAGVSLFLMQKIFSLSNIQIALICLLFVISFPFKFTIGMGQVNIITLGFLCLFLFFLWNAKGAFSLILAAFTKIFPILFVINVLLEKRWKFFFLVLGVLVISSLITVLIFGSSVHTSYIKHLSHVLGGNIFANGYYNQSLVGALSRLEIPVFAIQGIRVLILFITGFYLVKSNKNSIWKYIFFLQTILLVNIITWQHHLVLMLIPFVLLFKHLKALSEKLFLSIAYIFISINIAQPENFMDNGIHMLALAHGSIGMIIVWVLLMRVHYEEA